MLTYGKIKYDKIKAPTLDCTNIPVELTDETIHKRYQKVLKRMKEESIDTLIIYADLEHGSNFEYLTGFLPRFEEALLVIHENEKNYMLMGNENLNKVVHSRIPAQAIHVPHFSLPNQPMDTEYSLYDLLSKTDINKSKKIGIVGWKNFTQKIEDNKQTYDIPAYILDAIKQHNSNIVNATYLFIGQHGVRCTNDVNEIEHYEFGASLASDCMLKTMNQLKIDISEMRLAESLQALGQRNSVVTIAATGKRFEKANIYPTNKKVKLQDTISLTVGYKGGLSSRAGYAVKDKQQLPEQAKDYMDVLVKPYYLAIVIWLEYAHCNITGNELYSLINQVLPKSKYHWSLCPGHLTADEEWLSSPVYENSNEILESGMIFQIDIIPSLEGYGGISAECTVALADLSLRNKIKNQTPELWKRIENRRKYIIEELHINLNEDILPMSSTVGYLRPYLLNKEYAMCVE